jgi:hypothetical protein
MKVDLAPRRAALSSAALRYYVCSAQHALRYAPLPGFAAAIDALKIYNRAQSGDTYKRLVEVHETLDRNEGFYAGGNLHPSAVTYYYRGILRVLEAVVNGKDEFSTNDTFDFTEAAFFAALAVKANGAEVQHDEIQFQDGVWKNTVTRLG